MQVRRRLLRGRDYLLSGTNKERIMMHKHHILVIVIAVLMLVFFVQAIWVAIDSQSKSEKIKEQRERIEFLEKQIDRQGQAGLFEEAR